MKLRKSCVCMLAIILLMLFVTLPMHAETETQPSSEEMMMQNEEDKILQEGSLPESDVWKYSASDAERFASKSDMSALMTRLLNGALERSERIDIEDLYISADEFKNERVYQLLVNENPQLFYIDGCRLYYDSESRIVQNVVFNYQSQYKAVNSAEFDDAVFSILKHVNQQWSAVQKALYLHDWIVTNTDYEAGYYNAYNVLVEHRGVCQGYALAYQYLLKLCGINSEIISSNLLNHAWNLLEIDGGRYYVDCTWDDDTHHLYYKSTCSHDNFLVDERTFALKGHDTDDWVDTAGHSIMGMVSNLKYNNMFWHSTQVKIMPVNNEWYYIDNSDGRLYYYVFEAGRSFPYQNINEDWGIDYPMMHGDLAVYANHLYIAVPEGIIMIDDDHQLKRVFTISASESMKICGVRTNKSGIEYDLYRGAGSVNFISTVKHDATFDTAELRYENGTFDFYQNGIHNFSYFGFYDLNGNPDTRFLIADGMVAADVNGLFQDPSDSSTWYYLAQGQVQSGYTGLVEYHEQWFYVENGKLNTSFSGLITYDNGVFYVGAGRIAIEASGLVQNPDDLEKWYYASHGQIQTQYTGLVLYSHEWFYIMNGRLYNEFNGDVFYDEHQFHVTNGMVS